MTKKDKIDHGRSWRDEVDESKEAEVWRTDSGKTRTTGG